MKDAIIFFLLFNTHLTMFSLLFIDKFQEVLTPYPIQIADVFYVWL